MRVHSNGDKTWLESTECEGTGHVWVNAGRTGLLDVAFTAGTSASIPACERVAAAGACVEIPPMQRLSRGSGARALVRQLAAVETAQPSKGPRHGEVVPDARGRQGCAQVSATTGRVEGLELEIQSWKVPRTVTARTHAHGFILREPRAARAYHVRGLQRPQSCQPSGQDPTPATFII